MSKVLNSSDASHSSEGLNGVIAGYSTVLVAHINTLA